MRWIGGKPISLFQPRNAQVHGVCTHAFAATRNRTRSADLETRRYRSLLEREYEVEARDPASFEVERRESQRELRLVEGRRRGSHVGFAAAGRGGDREPCLAVEAVTVVDLGSQAPVVPMYALETRDRSVRARIDYCDQTVEPGTGAAVASEPQIPAPRGDSETERVPAGADEGELTLRQRSICERELRCGSGSGLRSITGAASQQPEENQGGGYVEQWNTTHRSDKIRIRRMDMPKRSRRLCTLIVATVVFAPVLGIDLQAQDIQPLAPVLEPNDREEPEDGVETPSPDEPALIPLPEAPNRTTAASRDRIRVTTVLPASWSGVVASYQPLWIGVLSPNGFGLHRWTPYFASSALAPVLTAHPFFGPWGVLSYDGWILDRYRQVWTSAQPPERFAEAGHWLQLGDRAMAERSATEAATAYRHVTLVAPDFPLGYLGLGAALAELGDDLGAAQAFRQSLDRYPAWLGLAVDWSLLYGRRDRLEAVQAAADRRAESGSANSQFVAGVLHMFGDDPTLGREMLSGLPDDPHAVHLMTRGPR